MEYGSLADVQSQFVIWGIDSHKWGESRLKLLSHESAAQNQLYKSVDIFSDKIMVKLL